MAYRVALSTAFKFFDILRDVQISDKLILIQIQSGYMKHTRESTAKIKAGTIWAQFNRILSPLTSATGIDITICLLTYCVPGYNDLNRIY